MNYSSIRQLDIANGPGCRVSIFISGCEHRCKNCFNPETWNFNYGKAFTDQTMEALLELLKPEHISGLSILGGEPLHPQNREGVLDIVRKVKSVYPSKSIWLWTGYLWEEVSNDLIGSGVDVVVDGKFVEELKDLRLKYRGSSNQRVINVSKSSELNPTLL